MRRQRVANSGQRLSVSRLGGAKVEAARGLARGLQQVGLPLPPAPGHDPEGCTRLLIGDEPLQRCPLVVPVKNLCRLDHAKPPDFIEIQL